ncbi:MAG: hypothetical protein A2505_03150 [Deltaproteobacteria bacterium RIFOXYD12_FULL_55_16]|nr:MAG: hypothetical protein A2505_03150 [Deltaproteobacteria bacterium RIFOXYD12_FULL_55_16]
MIKKISTLALVSLFSLPMVASAAGTPADLQAQIDALTKQLESIKTQMSVMQKAPATGQEASVKERVQALEDKSESWNLSSRIKLSGDFRARLDGVSADTPAHYTALGVGAGVADFITMGNLMNRYNANNGGTQTVGAGLDPNSFIARLPWVGAPLASPVAGNVMTGPTQSTTLSANEVAALNRAFAAAGNANFYTIFSAMMPAPISAVTPGLTDMRSLVELMQSPSLTAADRRQIFGYMGQPVTTAQDYKNDTIWTNRFRLNLNAKATEDVEFKGRLAMYKAWGMQNNPADYSANNGLGGGPFALSGYMSDFDGATTRNPNDSILRVDRAYVNWNAIGGSPFWFSIGRRPTTDGPPQNLKLGSDERMATPAAVMDWPFDGLTLGYAYNNLFGIEDAPGRIRFCYGRGFESGPDSDQNKTLNDVDFAGISWDVYNKGDRFFYLQSYGAFNVFNVPDNVKFGNPVEFALWKIDPNQYDPTDSSKDLLLGRANLGNLYHTSGLYMDKYQNLNYFLGASWSHTDAQGVDEMGTSLLGSWWDEPKNHNGYQFHIGARYDIKDLRLKLGAEFNHGSKYWIAMTPGHDDMYVSKLATRGDVYEVYGIYDIPGGEAISKYGKAWMRLGYQHYNYDYTGSGFWLGAPQKIEDLLNDPMAAQFYTPIKSMDQVYLTFEASF